MAGFGNFFKKNPLWILVLIVILGIVLRIAYLDATSIHSDEGGTINFAGRPTVPEVIEATQFDPHPPLDYIIIHFWLKLGMNEFTVRLLSVIFGVLAIPLIYLVGKEFFDNRVGLLSALILTISQLHIRHAQLVRSYTLIVFLALLSVYFFVRYFKNQKKLDLGIYTLVSIVSIYTHYFLSLLVAGQLLFLIYNAHKSRKYGVLKQWMLAFGVIILSVLPNMGRFLAQMAFSNQIYALQQSEALSFFSAGGDNIFVRVAMVFFHFSAGYLKANFANLLFIVIFVGVVLVFGISFFYELKFEEKKNELLLLLALIFAPIAAIAGVFAFNLIKASFVYARYMIFVSPFFYILISKGVLSLKKGSLKAIFIVLIVLFSSVSLYAYYTTNHTQENWREMSGFVQKGEQQNELIALYPPTYKFNFNYYYSGNLKTVAVPSNLDITTRNIAFGDVLKNLELITDKNSCNIVQYAKDNNYKGVWFVNAVPDVWDQNKLVKSCFDKNFKLKESKTNLFYDWYGNSDVDIEIYHYVSE